MAAMHPSPAVSPPSLLVPAAGASEKRRVALASVAGAVFLTGLKLGVGVWTASLGILAEAAHSLLDLLAAAMTVWAVQASARPADGRHTYGHGKFENLAALGETALLLVTCAWIVYEAVQRLLFKHVEVEVTVWGFVVMAVSIVVDLSRSRALRRVARQTGSQALEADALHFATDVWSSCVVILGLAAMWLAPRVGAGWLVHADTVAALVVAFVVVWVSVRLGRKSLADLLDEAPPGMREAVAGVVALPGVLEVVRVRLRQSGPEAFVDVTLAVEPKASLEQGHAIADAAERAIKALWPRADVVVHVEPAKHRQAAEPPAVTVRRLALEAGLPVHNLRFQDVLGSHSLELHVEVPAELSVAAAHAQVSALEATIQQALPNLSRVVTHIEPTVAGSTLDVSVPHGHFAELAAIHEVLAEQRGQGLAHDVTLVRGQNDLTLTMHWVVPADLPVSGAHARTEELERALRQRLPELGRVVIHVEPADAPSKPLR